MSIDEKTTEEKKTATKYDLKMQRRKEEKIKDKRELRATVSFSVIIMVALVCFVLYFPVRSLITLYSPFITVGGQSVTEGEFQYTYNVVKNNYINSYGSYLQYFGLDTTKDFNEQMYDESMTWKDYFEEMAGENIVRSKALKAQAEKDGFQYNTDKDYNEFMDNVTKTAKSAGVTINNLLKQQYGDLATTSRIEPYVREGFFVSAYYDKLKEDYKPTDEEAKAYYEEHKDDYDSFDYRIEEINAALPTEPTDLADEGAEVADGETYNPSEAEIEKAMADAKVTAEESKKTIKTAGELKENVLGNSEVSLVREWLMDDSRKAGDTEILEDEYSHKYYVVAFEKRYLNETPTVNLRALITSEDGQIYLDQWKNGAATEESFAELCDKFTLDTSVEGGLYENLTASDLTEKIQDWIFTEGRKPGDVECLEMTEDYDYVAYYVGEGAPKWKVDIQNTVSNTNLTEFVEKLCDETKLDDSKNRLAYIKKREAQEAAEAAEAEAEANAEDTADAEVVEEVAE